MDTQNIEQATKAKTSPKDFFINLSVIFFLYFIVVNAVQLLFETIDSVFPRTIQESYFTPSIAFPIAALMIAFPIFLLLSWALFLADKKESLKHDIPVRKWLGYLTLFVAGITIAIDLIVLLTAFLNGEEITIGFTLKVISVLLIAGFIFGYYLTDLMYKNTKPIKRYFAILSTLLVVLIIGFGFYVFGSPFTQKARRFDSQRISDLQTIQYQILSYWQAKKTAPATLNDLNNEITGTVVPRDPNTDLPYGYEKDSATTFKLCATFEREGQKQNNTQVVSMPITAYPSAISNEYWGHSIGLVCFDRTIDPSLYPANKLINY